MNNLVTRTLTGVGFVIVLIGSALLGQAVFSALFLLVTILGLWEFSTLIEKGGGMPDKVLSVVSGVILFITLAVIAMGLADTRLVLLNIPVLFMLFITELWRKKENPFENIAYTIIGILYIALPLGLSIFFFDSIYSSGYQHYGTLVGFLIILWLNDTGAYIIGSWLGRRLLFKRISPKKSWEGSVGGAIFALLGGYGASLIYTQHSTWQWLMIGLLIIVFGTLGDLVESMLKRSLNIKDSGDILPGHGGILDRFDALLVSVPFVFVFLAFFCKN